VLSPSPYKISEGVRELSTIIQEYEHETLYQIIPYDTNHKKFAILFINRDTNLYFLRILQIVNIGG